MSLTVRVLIGLVAGLAAGLLTDAAGGPALQAVPGLVEPVGTLWVNALRMTVIPLVVSLLIVGVASASSTGSAGRLGGRALALFLLAVLAAGTFAALAAPPLFSWMRIDPAAAEALRASAEGAAGQTAEGAARVPGLSQWLIDLVPANPVKAAADGAMLPLIVFTLALGIAVTRIAPEPRALVVRFFQALADAMMILVRWVLALAPVGVFALALPLATRLGTAAASAVAYYIVLVAALCAAMIVALVLIGAALGGVTVSRFLQASGPAQAVAFSSRSSLAALPAMIDGAETRLGLPTEISSFFLPFSAAVFRPGTPVMHIVGVLFVARLYGIDIDPAAMATIVATTALTSFTVPGIPGGTVLVMIPVLLAAGLPPAGAGLLLGVDTIPDMFRTTTNVTGHMAAAALLGRARRRQVTSADHETHLEETTGAH